MSETPLYDAYRAFLDDPGTPFTVPGHKRNPMLIDAFLALDLPHYGAVEDRRVSTRNLARAERLAGELWGADWCGFSVQGSTHGNIALALTVASPGDRVIVARTLHKSLFSGLVLAGLEPVWVRPDLDPDTGLVLGIPPERIQEAISTTPDARAVMLVEPSYVGGMSDVAAIADLAHAAGMVLTVDQAWGAHLGFHPALPPHALSLGADAFVTSIHKHVTGFTQASMVVAQRERIDLDRLESAFESIHTTSPSGAIFASIDRARALLEDHGECRARERRPSARQSRPLDLEDRQACQDRVAPHLVRGRTEHRSHAGHLRIGRQQVRSPRDEPAAIDLVQGDHVSIEGSEHGADLSRPLAALDVVAEVDVRERDPQRPDR
jgi:lysine decarboxylase